MSTILKTIKNFFSKELSAYKKRPWILCLGAPQSGKTSLLANAGFLKSIKKVDKNNISPTASIDAYISDQAVFIDPAGKQFSDILPLLKNGKRYHHQKALNGILFCIDIITLMQDNTRQKIIEKISRSIAATAHYKLKCPISLVITQCDHIPGFCDFFADLSKDELKQSLGLTLRKNKQAYSDSFQKAFSELIERLSQRLFWRLHHEQNLTKRQIISQVPLQLEMLQGTLQQVVDQVDWDQSHLNGIYFTSSTQQPTPTHPFALQIHQSLTITNPPCLPCSSTHAFFVQGPLRSLTQFAYYHSRELPPQWPRWISLPIAAIIIVVMTLFWHDSYNHNLMTVNTIQNQLNQIQASDSNTPIWLSHLNALYHSQASINKQPKMYRISGLDQTHSLKLKINKLYQKTLQTQFKPYLLSMLTKAINNDIKQGKPLALYNALRAYLMATQPKKYNLDAIKQWFSDQWNNEYANNTVLHDELEQHLNQLTRIDKLQWPSNPVLIKNAQNTLSKLPLSKMVYLELQGKYNQTNKAILPNAKDMLGIDLTEASISPFYSTDNFQQIYQHDIPKFAEKLILGDWVIGQSQKDTTHHNEAELIKQIREQYLHYYTQTWLNIISKIRLTPANSITDLQKSIHLITNPHSSLSQLLKLIMGNATLVKAQQSVVERNPSYQAIAQYVKQQGNYENITNALTQLQTYLQQINKAADTNKASYSAAIIRFQQAGAGDPINELLTLGKKEPQPIQSWLTNIANNAWKIILGNATSYLNSVWSTTVIPDYNDAIQNRFPVFSNSNKNISYTDFTNFFGPQGSIDIFFTHYLMPFVNMQHAYWTWKTLDNQTIAISQKTLNMLLRASIIQQMFYTDNHSELSFMFAMSLAKHNQIRSSTLNIDGNLLSLSSTAPITLNWPNRKNNTASLQIIDEDNAKHTWVESGPWALFRLIQAGNLTNLGTPQSFQLTFNWKDSHIVFNLSAKNRVNPFIPNIIDKFRLPQTL